MADTDKHTHLEIHALVDGGYVVRDGRFEGSNERTDNAVWNWRQERAAFSNLGDALTWMENRMVNKSPGAL